MVKASKTGRPYMPPDAVRLRAMWQALFSSGSGGGVLSKYSACGHDDVFAVGHEPVVQCPL
eukprot:3316242-Alexandrium_andersonii.AAC.1